MAEQRIRNAQVSGSTPLISLQKRGEPPGSDSAHQLIKTAQENIPVLFFIIDVITLQLSALKSR